MPLWVLACLAGTTCLVLRQEGASSPDMRCTQTPAPGSALSLQLLRTRGGTVDVQSRVLPYSGPWGWSGEGFCLVQSAFQDFCFSH